MSDGAEIRISNLTNNTTSSYQISEYIQAFIIVMYSFIIVIAIGGNGIVCYLVYAYKRMHTVPNYFIVNLAISDIMMALFCIPFTFVANLILNYWPFGETMCPVVLYIQVVAVFLSSYTLVAMSIDRYIVIVHPFRPRINAKQTVLTICAIWMLSFAIPLPTFLKSRIIYYSNTSGQCLERWENNTGQYLYGLTLMILQYFGPLTLLLFSYTKIGYNIWVKNIHGHDRNKRKLQLADAKKKPVSTSFLTFMRSKLVLKIRLTRKRKTVKPVLQRRSDAVMIKMMITVVVFYALCWLPLHIITLIGDHNPSIYNNKFVPILWLCSHWLSMSNSCYNPIIYLWMSPKFRAGLRLAFSGCCQRKLHVCSSDDEIFRKLGLGIQKFNAENRMEGKFAKMTPTSRPRAKIKFDEFIPKDYIHPGTLRSNT